MHIDVSWFHRVHEIDLARLGKNSSKWRHFAPTPAKLWPIGAWQANAGIRVVVKGLSAVLWCGKKYIHFRPNLFEAYIHPQPRYHLACIIYGSFQSTNIFQIATRRGKCSPSSNFLVRPAPPPGNRLIFDFGSLANTCKYHQNDPKNLGYHHLLSCFASKLAEFRIAWSALEQSLCGAEPSLRTTFPMIPPSLCAGGEVGTNGLTWPRRVWCHENHGF